MDNLLKQISFIKEIDKLKYIQRKTKLFNSERHENDAEHSWHLAMMAIVLSEHSDKPLNILIKFSPLQFYFFLQVFYNL